MKLEVRRIVMSDYATRADVAWLLFEQGNISKPLFMLTDFEMDQLIIAVDLQREENK